MEGKRLTLGELEALACLGTTGLLALHGAGVAGHEAFGAEGLLVVGVDFDKGAGDGEAESLGLSLVAATVDVDVYVVLLNAVEGLERLLDDVSEDRRGEVNLQGALVVVAGNVDNAGAFLNDNAGYGGFAAAYCIYCFNKIVFRRFGVSLILPC